MGRTDLAHERQTRILNATINQFCEQCRVECFACAIGEIHMNTAEPFPGYKSEDTHKVNWPEFNAKGHHHVMWNGVSNETVPCGSDRANELALDHQRWARREEEQKAPSANARQVGGAHYGLREYQHWDIVVEFDLDYFQGQITKYVMRYNKKNGLQDLEKAQHFLEKLIGEIRAGRIPEKLP